VNTNAIPVSSPSRLPAARHTRRALLIVLGGIATLAAGGEAAAGKSSKKKKRQRGRSCGNGMCVDPASR
jgi:hypothetical protein